jgi:Flp pilus assembly protein TadD/peroxiredoxin
MTAKERDFRRLTRRALLKSLGAGPLLLRPSLLEGARLLFAAPAPPSTGIEFADVRLIPHYPARSPLQDVLRLVAPGLDEYTSEKHASEIGEVLERWAAGLKSGDLSALRTSLEPDLEAFSPVIKKETPLRSGSNIEVLRREFAEAPQPGKERFLKAFAAGMEGSGQVQTAEFEITSIQEVAASPLTARTDIRYTMVLGASGQVHREQRIGTWRLKWVRDRASNQWSVQRWEAGSETVSLSRAPVFVDVTEHALGGTASYKAQLTRGSDEWRTILDGACGIDVYGNNGVAVGDFDNDGLDDLYISQPAGLPNRLYRNRGDGTFEDVTEKAGVAVLDNTACALFADFRNCGLQDLLVVCGTGPLLFLNTGHGTFTLERDAFRFAQPPQGSFTHAAIADYDRDGLLDIYFCVYSYYLGLDQYHYPVPYYDARNGPPNFLFHNEGNGTFTDKTEAAGLNVDNDRYSFAAAWGESGNSAGPDLYIANDFGRNTFYRNTGKGSFKIASTSSHVEDVGAGMSATWSDVDNDGRQDIYVANMWSAAGQRVSEQPIFHAEAPKEIRAFYQRHAQGNALYHNLGDGTFENNGVTAGVDAGRWAWCSDFWDFDHDGYDDLYVTNGYISKSGSSDTDLGSFFWRQVVAKSPDDSTPSPAYERGWNALNELIRSDHSWSGLERNVIFANNRDGTFSDVSGISGLDFIEDSRSFALSDLDHDGRLEVILKNRNAPQVRVLHNAMKVIGDSIGFHLRGTKSNRDGIGAAVTVQTGDLRQTKYLQAGSGFLAQHSKEVFFGLGNTSAAVQATVRWPSGLRQTFANLPRNHRVNLEEGRATFTAIAFTPASEYVAVEVTPPEKSMQLETDSWLIDPLKAPEFSLPDLNGELHSLQALRESVILLHFWSTRSPVCLDQLRALQQGRTAFGNARITVVAVNVDDAGDEERARAVASSQRFAFLMLFGTDEVAGTYNIIYRYLFDRRRDLPLPSSFLIDRGGMIVKVYQAQVDARRIVDDVSNAPSTTGERIEKALPFAGKLYQGSFERNDFTYGVAMFQHGYLDQAAESFKQVVASKPDNAEGYYNLGTLSLRRKDAADARKYLEQALKLRPNYPEAWNNLGMIAVQDGQPEEAIRSFQQSLLLRPNYATALLNLGNIYRRQGEFQKAEDSLRRAVTLEPGDPEANYSLGMFYAQQAQLTSASEYLQKAIQIRPDYPEALNNLGVLFVRQQQYAEAEEQFKTCLRLAPAFEQSYINLARLYVLRQEKDQARKTLEDLLRISPENAAAKQGLELLR